RRHAARTPTSAKCSMAAVTARHAERPPRPHLVTKLLPHTCGICCTLMRGTPRAGFLISGESPGNVYPEMSTSPRTILVIEDDAPIRRGIVDALGYAGYRAIEAADASRGAELAVGVDCDLVLLDLVLPGGVAGNGPAGLDILGKIRATRPTLPVIILTARGTESDRVRGLRLGADDYVVKPFSVSELLAR